jgi:hypothetical protein
MEKVIIEFVLAQAEGKQQVMVPEGTSWLKAGTNNGRLVVWGEAFAGRPAIIPTKFLVMETGRQFTAEANGRSYMGTVQLGMHTYHVFKAL